MKRNSRINPFNAKYLEINYVIQSENNETYLSDDNVHRQYHIS